MTRPDALTKTYDIPADIWESARHIAIANREAPLTHLTLIIAKAILSTRAEQREEDAAILEVMADEHDAAAVIGPDELATVSHRVAEKALNRAAAAIRNGGK